MILSEPFINEDLFFEHDLLILAQISTFAYDVLQTFNDIVIFCDNICLKIKILNKN